MTNETSEVEVLTPIKTHNDIKDANLSIMGEIYNDAKMSPKEKMKSFSIGVRNHVALNGDLNKRIKLLNSMGIKVDDAVKMLTVDEK